MLTLTVLESLKIPNSMVVIGKQVNLASLEYGQHGGNEAANKPNKKNPCLLQERKTFLDLFRRSSKMDFSNCCSSS